MKQTALALILCLTIATCFLVPTRVFAQRLNFAAAWEDVTDGAGTWPGSTFPDQVSAGLFQFTVTDSVARERSFAFDTAGGRLGDSNTNGGFELNGIAAGNISITDPGPGHEFQIGWRPNSPIRLDSVRYGTSITNSHTYRVRLIRNFGIPGQVVNTLAQPSDCCSPTPVTEALESPITVTNLDLIEFALSNNDSPSERNVVFFDLRISTVLGDCNFDGEVTFLDITPFVAILQSGTFLEQADVDQDGAVTFSDIAPFIAVLSGS